MMTATKDHFAALADCLDYPADGFQAVVAQAATVLAGACPKAGERLQTFADYIAPREMTELEELFTRTFDVNPSCTLEIGWHLYGEQYERGAFLVRMRELLREYGIVEGSELPDHLSYTLLLLGRLTEESAQALVVSEVIPAVAKMREGFNEGENPYTAVVDAIWIALNESYSPNSEARS